jgi:hypothetical protein
LGGLNCFTEESQNTTFSISGVLEASSSADLTPINLHSVVSVIDYSVILRKLKHLGKVLSSNEVRHSFAKNTYFVDVNTLASVH